MIKLNDLALSSAARTLGETIQYKIVWERLGGGELAVPATRVKNWRASARATIEKYLERVGVDKSLVWSAVVSEREACIADAEAVVKLLDEEVERQQRMGAGYHYVQAAKAQRRAANRVAITLRERRRLTKLAK